MKTLKTLALLGAMAAASSAMANTITPVNHAWTPGTSITYNAQLSSGEIHAGDAFTIFDVGGFTGVLSLPAGWTWSVAPFGSDPAGSNFGIAPSASLTPDSWDANVTFIYRGNPQQNINTPFTDLGLFELGTVSTARHEDDWTSRDHTINDETIVGDGLTGPAKVQTLLVPNTIPDGGATAMLLGLGVLGLGAIRRKS